MSVTNKFFTDNMGGTVANNYIGKIGEVFYDTTGDTPLRISDGITPGGIPFGITSVSRSFNPNFRTANGTLVGITQSGTYVKQGLIVHFRINVDFANCTDFAAASNTGYQVDLPFTSEATMTQRGGTLHQTANGGSLYHIAGITDIESNTTIMKLYYSGSTTDLPWRAVAPVGATTNTSHFDISGAYQTTNTSVG